MEVDHIGILVRARAGANLDECHIFAAFAWLCDDHRHGVFFRVVFQNPGSVFVPIVSLETCAVYRRMAVAIACRRMRHTHPIFLDHFATG
jgi:hypothetical protein